MFTPRSSRTGSEANFGRSHQLLEEFAGALAAEWDARGVRRIIVSRLLEWSGCVSAAVYDLDNGGDTYAVSQLSGANGPAGGATFAARSALARWLRVNERPLVIPGDRAVLDYLPQAERDALTVIGAGVCVPMVSLERLVGFILLTAPPGGLRLDPHDLDLLNACGRQAALACERVARLELERDQLAAAARAQQLALAGQLAASMAHEVRNPLAAIRSGVQYVMDPGGRWPDKVDLLRQVIEEVDRINRTISGVLGLSRPRELESTDLDWVEVVDQSLVLFAPYFEHHQLTLTRQAGDARLRVRGDAGELRQVLLNVLLNACQATPEGGQIGVASHRVSRAAHAERTLAAVTVADSGRGMTDAQCVKAFEPFFTTKATGTGLGLAISRQIMTRHGGSIRLESRMGQGTTAFLTLPLAEA